MFPAVLALGIWYSWWAALLCFLATGPVKAGLVDMFGVDPVQPAVSAAAWQLARQSWSIAKSGTPTYVPGFIIPCC